ncbi:hypothetical protein OIU74_017556 [Salix koriyanagi]|uniref:Uncharacterized protein n=1 Tax=Salix koriyanagi TaxID=2511006 RepID=A0A9Q1AH92_9ROSI|nr:hypothetical protein OIU74_017556 [Salix koriyanagi]
MWSSHGEVHHVSLLHRLRSRVCYLSFQSLRISINTCPATAATAAGHGHCCCRYYLSMLLLPIKSWSGIIKAFQLLYVNCIVI